METPCPICGKPTKREGGWEDGGEKCMDGCYSFNHSYGVYEVNYSCHGMESLTLGWHYTETKEERAERTALTNLFLQRVRKISCK